MMAFVLLLLATVLYDGALGTPEWGGSKPALRRLAGWAARLSAIRTAGLVAFWLVFLGAYPRQRGHGAVCPLARRGCAQLRPHPGPDRHRLPRGTLSHFLLIQGQYIIPLALRPVRLRLESLRHGRLSRRYRARRRALCLVHGGRGDPARAMSGGPSRPPQGDALCSLRGARALSSSAADRADGGLHLRGPVDPRRPIVEPRARAPSRRCTESHSLPTLCCPSRATAACSRSARKAAEAETDLSGARLGLPRRQRARTSPTCSTPTCSLIAGARRRRDEPLRPARSTPPPPPCASTSGDCGSSARTPRPSPSASAISSSSASCRRRGLSDAAGDLGAGRRRRPPWSTLPWHLVALMEEAVSAAGRHSRKPRPTPRCRLARSRPLGGH